MELLSNLAKQFQQIYDTVDIVCAAGLIYLLVRGRKHLKGVRFGVLALALVPAFYFLLFVVTAASEVQERYYQPILPFLIVLSALGLYCLGKDIGSRKVIYCILGVVLVGFLVDTLRTPLRAHRRPQTEAGLWLGSHDPEYKGFVISRYSQPVYYAGMKMFDPRGTEDLFRSLLARGVEFKYFVLDGHSRKDQQWLKKYIDAHNWQLIYRNEERDLRIYQNPDFGVRHAASTAR